MHDVQIYTRIVFWNAWICLKATHMQSCILNQMSSDRMKHPWSLSHTSIYITEWKMHDHVFYLPLFQYIMLLRCWKMLWEEKKRNIMMNVFQQNNGRKKSTWIIRISLDDLIRGVHVYAGLFSFHYEPLVNDTAKISITIIGLRCSVSLDDNV